MLHSAHDADFAAHRSHQSLTRPVPDLGFVVPQGARNVR